MSKSSYENFDKPPESLKVFFIPQACFRAFRISYYLGRQIFKSLETNMCTQPKGPMGKSKALETALNNKLLGSHEHLKKCVFSPPLPAVPPMAGARGEDQVGVDSLRMSFFCTKDVSKGHGLGFVVDSKGDFADVSTWSPNEEFAAAQLTDGARKAGGAN